ncbi:AraC family transcriptional regulator [Mesorhizobium sp. CO1-1-7]|uniref:AraC family transcriptional regulator n=1 Tax=unclassified Mesorhizobium TaxID=325217 RepID=UPI0011281027|nr:MULTISPECIES: AraC family transcriptional regulator [unclassified Mesorhizobium]MBZ9932203.1 AraC family transcriptional regulator [Mesorhizobium sp. BR1-1-5]MBZ9746710.1 AraC family transcriptional regulator [Mesorhizobium sp. CO1-1-7]MBZ9906087.1 AraC family transcriptional regulator [Mesorhizobium sp. BR115XR7A]TPK22019.1 helix-turn-helix domain-containing protein [Mesorhizobium sp. B2-5-9]TPL68840.1 helix-turn-helix domain-containing protein [Mesorhizobium sp. B2-3-15]
MKAALQNYHARMQRVLDHIDQHLNGNLDLDALSGIAAFSKYHFHRQFTATFGLSVHRYVQLARMKRASYRLAFRDAESVTDIAMDAGYDAPDAFARAFRQRFGQSPSSFRKSPDWAPWLAAFGPMDNARSKLMHITYDHDDVTIRDVPPTPVAIMEHRGDRATLGDTIQRFIAWRKAAGLSPETSPTFNVFRSERIPANPADYSMDLCVGTDLPIDADDGQMMAGVIPGGRCAVLRVVHNTNNLEPAALYLYRDWLPASGEEARDFPIYCQRHFSMFPNVPVPDVVCELFLPLK